MNTAPDAPIFYQNIFKVWNLFDVTNGQDSRSLFWLLQEPLIHGTRFEKVVDSSHFPANTGLLIKAGCTTLGHLVNIAGPDFENIEGTATKLGFKSLRLVRQLLMKWKSALKEEELRSIVDFCQGLLKPNEEDLFHLLILSPKMVECEVGLGDISHAIFTRISSVKPVP